MIQEKSWTKAFKSLVSGMAQLLMIVNLLVFCWKGDYFLASNIQNWQWLVFGRVISSVVHVVNSFLFLNVAVICFVPAERQIDTTSSVRV